MEDQSLHNSRVRTISEGLQNFIDSMVEEIALEGKPFDTQKKYLKKFGENEGLDYEQLESKIYTFIDILDNIKNTPNKLMEKFAEEKGQDCHISDSMIKDLQGSISQKVRHVVPKLNESEGYYYFADSEGKSIIPGKWVDAWEFSEGLAAVAKSIPGEKYWKYGYIDVTGKTVIPFHWGNAESFNEGLAVVAPDHGDHGYIDKTGRLVIPCKYGAAGYFCNNRAPVWDNTIGKGGYIDKTGSVIIPYQWNDAWYFEDGVAWVKLSGPYRLINKNGELV